MTRFRSRTAVAGLALLASAPALMFAQAPPPIRQISSVVASATETLGQLPSVRPLSNGNLLVNDRGNRRVLLMNPALAVVRVVLDTTPGMVRNYPDQPGSLISYPGDSTLFLDTRATSLLVIDPAGSVVRVLAPPQPSDVLSLQPKAVGQSGTDAQGRLVYVSSPNRAPTHADGTPLATGDTIDMPVIRATFGRQSVDTVAIIHYPMPPVNVNMADSTGRRIISRIVTPLSATAPRTDVFALTSDGSLAIVRVQDYHVDWIRPDGSREATPKIPHEWHRLSDDEKKHLADSTQAALDSANARSYAQTRSMPFIQKVQAVADIPDYATPFVAGAPVAEPNGNLWILSNNYPKPPGGPLYDVINSHGVLIDRVQLPGGCTLAGLGHNVAYVTSRDGLANSLVAMRVR